MCVVVDVSVCDDGGARERERERERKRECPHAQTCGDTRTQMSVNLAYEAGVYVVVSV